MTSARALFDLWIDAAEEAYAQVALSPEFREVYGAYVNAQMRLRNGMPRIDLPSRRQASRNGLALSVH